MENLRFAVLIDGENISSKYVSVMFDELTKYGVITYRRIYGDWTSRNTARWKRVLLENSITPIQQFYNTVGKNASDSTLIIDAMDILYTGNVDGFCIVSSDGDFTRLASRLRESGMFVVGMGENKTPRSFRNACNVFTSLENLIEDDGAEVDNDEVLDNEHEDLSGSDNEREDKSGKSKKKYKEEKSHIVSKKEVENTIITMIMENENKGKLTGLAEIGSRLQNKYPDFDVRNYGYSLLSKFLEEIDSVTVIKNNNIVNVELKESKNAREEVDEYIIEVLKKHDNKLGVTEIGHLIHQKFSNFSPKDYGYSQLTKYVQSIPGIKITHDDKQRKLAKLKK